jgi:hypothetical protein
MSYKFGGQSQLVRCGAEQSKQAIGNECDAATLLNIALLIYNS